MCGKILLRVVGINRGIGVVSRVADIKDHRIAIRDGHIEIGGGVIRAARAGRATAVCDYIRVIDIDRRTVIGARDAADRNVHAGSGPHDIEQINCQGKAGGRAEGPPQFATGLADAPGAGGRAGYTGPGKATAIERIDIAGARSAIRCV